MEIADITDAVVMGIRKTTRRIFKRSQELVPVRTGFLKSTGRMVSTIDGAYVEYGAPYAAVVEFGRKVNHTVRYDVTEKNVIKVKGHARKSHVRADGTFVSASTIRDHAKVSKTGEITVNKVKRSPSKRMKTILAPRPGRYYLTNATMEEVGGLKDDIAFYAKQIKK